jgi:hypothetical protein
VKPKEDAIPQPDDKSAEDSDKQLKVTCFSCAEWGHFSMDGKAHKLCFICQTAEHVGRDCPSGRSL